MRYSLNNKLGDDVMNQGGVGCIRQTNLLQERRSMSEMSVEELLWVQKICVRKFFVSKRFMLG